MTQKVTHEQFLAAWHQTGGSAAETARLLGLTERGVHGRRRRQEKLLGITLRSFSPKSPDKKLPPPPGRIQIELKNGSVLVGSDAHIWGTNWTTAQRAFIKAAKELCPSAVVVNGDLFDGARISRHPHGIWSEEQRPNVKQELEACQAFMGAVYDASRAAKHYYLWGNHCQRFEARLSAMVPEFEGVHGTALRDHFPEWAMGMSLWVNDCVIKHRWHNGIHAVYNNAVKGGKSIVTGHLHSLKVTPWTDWNGTRYGVDTGTLADTHGRQFDYMEDNSRNHRSGFVVLTFKDGKLLMPEPAQVWDENSIEFRGRVWEV